MISRRLLVLKKYYAHGDSFGLDADADPDKEMLSEAMPASPFDPWVCMTGLFADNVFIDSSVIASIE